MDCVVAHSAYGQEDGGVTELPPSAERQLMVNVLAVSFLTDLTGWVGGEVVGPESPVDPQSLLPFLTYLS